MTNLPKTKKLDLDLAGGWLTIWLNSPENRNALSAEMSAELVTVFDAVRNDRSIRGITLRGRNGLFCAGGDLKGMKSTANQDASATERRMAAVALSQQGGELFKSLNTLPQVVIVLVEGAAMAGGLGLVCCADVIAVTHDARFALTETKLGITPAQIAPYIVQRFGQPTARRLMLTGAQFRGSDALTLGLADHVADNAAGLDAYETTIRQQVLACAPGATAVTKKIVLAAPHLKATSMISFAAEKFADCMLSDEAQEGLSAFIEKRNPNWATGGEKA
ncbi:isohexenylglutaconyl-CoA hydratase [Kordiimonas sediminis]|uniref:Isohexenylglutaconyl-CoA hydratase n=1 Tax=Kordiimonas sediminis TaxID=1735581 RepID=A0A919AY27_9PROT|nr:enoyl-CoA hydratase-related protein [Kordiimonas sediminis]GHF31181.1 isohexenylglutaconyl-CoA hydratase [Kordiimonas sediminis]